MENECLDSPLIQKEMLDQNIIGACSFLNCKYTLVLAIPGFLLATFYSICSPVSPLRKFLPVITEQKLTVTAIARTFVRNLELQNSRFWRRPSDYFAEVYDQWTLDSAPWSLASHVIKWRHLCDSLINYFTMTRILLGHYSKWFSTYLL